MRQLWKNLVIEGIISLELYKLANKVTFITQLIIGKKTIQIASWKWLIEIAYQNYQLK
jgi:hypothetical protein